MQANITSIGHLAGEIQRPVSVIRAIADRYQIRPTITINGVPHFSDEDARRIANAIPSDRRPEETATH